MKRLTRTLTCLLIVSSPLRLLAGASPLDQQSLSQTIRGVAPASECQVQPQSVRVAYHVDKKVVHPKLKDGSTGKQSITVEVPQDDGWLVEVSRADHPYHAQLYRPGVLDLTAPRPGAQGPHYRTAATEETRSRGSIVVDIGFGEKADLNLVKKVYEKLAAAIEELPKVNAQ